MNGIEKITARIAADAQVEIDALRADTDVQCADIARRYDEQARREAEAILAKGRADAEQQVERLDSVAALEGRKRTLAAKQEMMDRAFELALDKLCALPRDEMVELLAALAVRAARTGREEIILNAQQREELGPDVCERANAALARAVAPKLPQELTDTKVGAFVGKVVAGVSAIAQGTALLTLADEIRPIKGGLILRDGDVEVNCAFETLVRLQRGELERQVAAILFP